MWTQYGDDHKENYSDSESPEAAKQSLFDRLYHGASRPLNITRNSFITQQRRDIYNNNNSNSNRKSNSNRNKSKVSAVAKPQKKSIQTKITSYTMKPSKPTVAKPKATTTTTKPKRNHSVLKNAAQINDKSTIKTKPVNSVSVSESEPECKHEEAAVVEAKAPPKTPEQQKKPFFATKRITHKETAAAATKEIPPEYNNLFALPAKADDADQKAEMDDEADVGGSVVVTDFVAEVVEVVAAVDAELVHHSTSIKEDVAVAVNADTSTNAKKAKGTNFEFQLFGGNSDNGFTVPVAEKEEITKQTQWQNCLRFSNDGLLIVEAYCKFFGPCKIMDPFTDDVINQIIVARQASQKRHNANADRNHNYHSLSYYKNKNQLGSGGKGLSSRPPTEQYTHLDVKYVRINMTTFEAMVKHSAQMLQRGSPQKGSRFLRRQSQMAGLEEFTAFSSPIPTYLFFRNGHKVAQLKGAKVHKFRTLVELHSKQIVKKNRPQTAGALHSRLHSHSTRYPSPIKRRTLRSRRHLTKIAKNVEIRAQSVPEPVTAYTIRGIGYGTSLSADASLVGSPSKSETYFADVWRHHENGSEDIRNLIKNLHQNDDAQTPSTFSPVAGTKTTVHSMGTSTEV